MRNNKDEVTSIQLLKETRAKLYTQQVRNTQDGEKPPTPDEIINMMFATLDDQKARIEQLDATNKSHMQTISQLTEERDDARAHIWQDFDDTRIQRTIPASGKLSLDKLAGKTVKIIVVS